MQEILHYHQNETQNSVSPLNTDNTVCSSDECKSPAGENDCAGEKLQTPQPSDTVEFNIPDDNLQLDDSDDLSDYSHLSDEELASKFGASPQIIKTLRKSLENIRNLSQNVKNSELDLQINSLSSSEFYSDIALYSDQLKKYASQNNCSIKTAYNSLFAEKKYLEIKKLTEQKCKENFSKRKNRCIEASRGGSSNSTFNNFPSLSREQLAAAKAYGISPSEYAKYLNN